MAVRLKWVIRKNMFLSRLENLNTENYHDKKLTVSRKNLLAWLISLYVTKMSQNPNCSKLAMNRKNDNNVIISRHDVIFNFLDVLFFWLSLVTGPSFMSISSLVPELWHLSFIRDWPEIRKSEIPTSEFCPISWDWGKLRIPYLARMSLMVRDGFTWIYSIVLLLVCINVIVDVVSEVGMDDDYLQFFCKWPSSLITFQPNYIYAIRWFEILISQVHAAEFPKHITMSIFSNTATILTLEVEVRV